MEGIGSFFFLPRKFCLEEQIVGLLEWKFGLNANEESKEIKDSLG